MRDKKYMPTKKSKKPSLLNQQKTFTIKQVLFFVILFALVTCIAIVKSFAAPSNGKRGGGSGSSSLSIVMVTDKNADGLPNWGDSITFKVSTAATTQPYVQLNCSQNQVVVYQHQAGIYLSYPWSQNYVLSSSNWTTGAASCTALLQYNSGKRTLTLTTLNFQVNP